MVLQMGTAVRDNISLHCSSSGKSAAFGETPVEKMSGYGILFQDFSVSILTSDSLDVASLTKSAPPSDPAEFTASRYDFVLDVIFLSHVLPALLFLSPENTALLVFVVADKDLVN